MSNTTIDRRNYQRLGMQRLFHGVYGPVTGQTGDVWQQRRRLWLDRLRAALELYSDRDPVLYGATALQAMGVALPQTVEQWDVIHLLIEQDAERPRRAGILVHSGRRGRRVWGRFGDLPVLHPVDHWLQLAPCGEDDMVQVGDGFVRRQEPLMTIGEMSSRLQVLTGQDGCKLARRALKRVRPGTDSIYESKTRLVLINAHLPEPAVNPPVWCVAVDATYYVDMGYLAEKVAVEYDGQVHVGDRMQMEMDADRRRNLQDEGWMIISVTASRLRSPGGLIRSVENALILRSSPDRLRRSAHR